MVEPQWDQEAVDMEDDAESLAVSCYECGGRGWFVDCIDDLCHGQDQCIHGNPPRRCRNCNKDGEREDCY